LIVRPHRLALAAAPLAGLLLLVLLAGAAHLAAVAGAGASTCGGAAGLVAAASASPTADREIPAGLVALYGQASAAYRLGPNGWAWLAAINRVETDFGRDLSTSSAGAVGWMQFEPATWAVYGVDANHDGRRDPYDPADAIAAAARYLSASGAPADWERAVRTYNGGPGNVGSPSTLGYWQSVAASAAAYLGTGTPASAAPSAGFGPGTPVDYVGGIGTSASAAPVGCEPCPPAEPLSPALATAAAAVIPSAPAATPAPATATAADAAVAPARAIPPPPAAAAQCAAAGAVPLAPGDRAVIRSDGLAAAPAGAPPAVRAMIAAGNQLIGKPYVYGGGHADFRLADGYDCSSSVSWSLHGAGYLTAPEDSSTLEGFGAPGAGLWVTVFANPGHAFVYVAGIRLDTSPQPGDGHFDQPGPRWRPATRSTDGFVARHPPDL
jgi:hypothetical protein